MKIQKLGTMPYSQAHEDMLQHHARVAEGGEEIIMIVEHPPVVTMGNRFLEHDLVVSPNHYSGRGVEFVHTDRGGSATVHEPGQTVVYPILRVNGTSLSVRKFVWILEEAMIRVAAEFGVCAARDSINPGIWVGKNKLGAIGIRVSQRVSRHGLAFNVNNDMSTFQLIVPCGLRERGVTSLAREMASVGKMSEASKLYAENVGEKIAREIVGLVEQVCISEDAFVKKHEG